jgi:hypothetical protein
VASAFTPNESLMPVSHNKHIADHVVEIAASRMHDHDPEVRAMAGEIMRLAQNRPPLGSLEHYSALTIARRYAGMQRSAFEGTILDDHRPTTLADVLLSESGAHKRYK